MSVCLCTASTATVNVYCKLYNYILCHTLTSIFGIHSRPMRDWIPELPDLQRLMMPGGAVGQNNRFSLSSNKQTPTAMRCTHEEIPFKRCTMYYNIHGLISWLLW